MYWKHCITAVFGAAIMTVPANTTAQTTGQPQAQEGRQEQLGEQATHDVTRADRLIGQTVRDRQDERSGRIHDLGLNVQEGRVAYVVVTRGGIWGIGGDTVALPWQQVQPDPATRAVRIDQQQLQQARAIDTDQPWPEALGGDEPVGTAGSAQQPGSVPMSRVLDMDVHNKQDERLGRIHDVAIARDGSIKYAVIAHGGFLGVGDNYTAVPWNRLTVDAQREEAVLDVREEQLQNARRFDDRGRWPASVDWPFGNQR